MVQNFIEKVHFQPNKMVINTTSGHTMELGPLLYKIFTNLQKNCIMYVLFIFLLLYLLEISFPHITV